MGTSIMQNGRLDRLQPMTVGALIQHELLREGLRAVLGQIDRVEAVHVCDVSPDGLLAPEPLPDVLVATPAELPLLELVKNATPVPRLRILLLVDVVQLKTLEFASLSTVDGVVLQDGLSAEALDDALRQLSAGQSPMPSFLARKLMAQASTAVAGPRMRPVTLTSREHEALVLLADGMSNKEIARALGVSTHGAKRLVGSVLIKLGAPNRTAAVVNAMKVGLVESP